MAFPSVKEPFQPCNYTAQLAAIKLTELTETFHTACSDEWLATATDSTIIEQVNLANVHFLSVIGLAKNVLRQAKRQATEQDLAEWDLAYQQSITAWLRAAVRLSARANQATSLAKGMKLNITSAQEQLQPVDYSQLIAAMKAQDAREVAA